MLTLAIDAAILMMVATLVLNFWVLMRGPERVDRLLALDTMSINSVALLVLIGISKGTTVYFEAAVVIAMLGFISTVALCRFLLRRRVLE